MAEQLDDVARVHPDLVHHRERPVPAGRHHVGLPCPHADRVAVLEELVAELAVERGQLGRVDADQVEREVALGLQVGEVGVLGRGAGHRGQAHVDARRAHGNAGRGQRLDVQARRLAEAQAAAQEAGDVDPQGGQRRRAGAHDPGDGGTPSSPPAERRRRCSSAASVPWPAARPRTRSSRDRTSASSSSSTSR